MNLEINKNNNIIKSEINLEKNLNNLIDNELDKKNLEGHAYSPGRDSDEFYSDNEIAQQLDYKTNYNLGTLKIIGEYYKLSCRNLKKDELIKRIIKFENDLLKIDIVEKRKRLWENIIELKNDSFFSKFIII